MKSKRHQRDNFVNQWFQTEYDLVGILSTSCLFQWLWKGPLYGFIKFLIIQRSR